MVNTERQLRVFDFVDRLRSLEGDLVAIQEAIDAELKWYGLEFVTCAELPPLGQDGEGVILHNTRPIEFVRRYIEEQYVACDPVHLELRYAIRPYSWCEIRQRRSFNSKQKALMSEAESAGFNNGLIIPLASERGVLTAFTPCGRDPDLSRDSRLAIDVIGTYSISALQNCRRKQACRTQRHEMLTRREKEILQFVADGKSDHEVADILSIAESTVNTHMQNIKRKLGVTRRTNAVVRAIQMGEITLA